MGVDIIWEEADFRVTDTMEMIIALNCGEAATGSAWGTFFYV